jgi:hypothetical protein
MEKIQNRDIHITPQHTGGFTLSYVTDEGDYYHERYMGYTVREAKARFKLYVYAEDSVIFRNMDSWPASTQRRKPA